MLEALRSLGVKYELVGTTLTVEGKGLRTFQTPTLPLFCGNSATTLRLLTGAVVASGIKATLDGSAGLRRRPMDRIVQPLQQMGALIESTQGCAPIHLQPASFPLKPADHTLPVASAQAKTCLLLAALSSKQPSMIREPGLSRDHTERMLRSMGVNISSDMCVVDGQQYFQTTLMPPNHPLALKPLNLKLPGDFSTAAFLIVAALITPGSVITLKQVGLNSTRTGLLDVLIAMGADILITGQSTQNSEPIGDITVRHSQLHGVQINDDQVVRMIDEFPVFATAAAFANGPSTVSDAGELRHKESDRISALCEEMRLLGVDISERPDGFVIKGKGVVDGGFVRSHGDHRLAMSLSLVGMAASQPVVVNDAEIIAESYPEFSQTFQGLGGSLVVES